MSFYGQVLYEFTKLFSKINISNNNNETATTPASGSQPSLVAADRWDQIDFKGGNRWIQLSSNATDKSVTISHSAPGQVEASKTVIGFKPLTEEEFLAIPKEQRDQFVQLEPAQCIQTTKSQYDAAGHSVDAETSYFIMPANATELTLDVITASHLAVPASDTTEYALDSANQGISIADYLDKNKYLNQDYLQQAMEDHLKEKGYVKEDFTGVIGDMYPGNKPTEQKTLANTIGVVNNNTGGLSALMHALPNNNDTNATKIYTITEAFGLIINELDKLEARVRSQEDFEETQKNANKGLSSRIAVLEAEHGIEDSE